MKAETIQKLRELSDKELATILIGMLCTNDQVYAAFVEATTRTPQNIVHLEMITQSQYGSGETSIVRFSLTQEALDKLIAVAPSFGNNKVAFIKEVRVLTGAPLREAKVFSEAVIPKYTTVGWK